MKYLIFVMLVFSNSLFAQTDIQLKDLGLFNPYVTEDQFSKKIAEARVHKLHAHKHLGYLTLTLATASAVTAIMAKKEVDKDRAARGGAKASSDAKNFDLHMALGAATLVSYYTTAYYSLSAPKIKNTEDDKKRKIHKHLAYIHGTAFVLAPVLGLMAYKDYDKGQDPSGAAKLHRPVMLTGIAALVSAFATITF